MQLAIGADAETDEDGSWGAVWAVSGAQEREGSVRVVGRKLMPRLGPTDDEGTSPLGLDRPGRSQLGLGPAANARVNGVQVWA
jgi:hypothetical protein